MSNETYFGKWGKVPFDGDVRPASSINPNRPAENRTNKKHHFVSTTYMKGFVGDGDRLVVYRQEAPEEPLLMQPTAIGYENHYYSQKLPDGTLESHRFEDLWS